MGRTNRPNGLVTLTTYLVLRLVPVVADADLNCERRIERIRVAHLLAHEFLYCANFRVRDLQQQLVVHLQHEASAATFVAQATMNRDHRLLDDVRVRPLHDEVDGETLAERARLPVRRTDFRRRPAPAEQARRVAVALRLLDRAVDEVLHQREPREVRVDVLLRLLPRYLEVLREAEGGDPVDDAEVDHFRDRAIAGCQLRRLLPEHLDRGRRVDVVAACERFAQLWLAGDVR